MTPDPLQIKNILLFKGGKNKISKKGTWTNASVSLAKQVDALGAYVQSVGGGPVVPRDANGQIAEASLIGSDVARGGDLFRLNCASCHNFTGRGGALSSGKYAPVLDPATPAQIYTAMLSGPQNMPKFSDRQLSPEAKRDIIAYVKTSSDTLNPCLLYTTDAADQKESCNSGWRRYHKKQKIVEYSA